MTPLPETLSWGLMVRGSVHLALPAATWSKTASRMGSLMVLAVRTGSVGRMPTLSPVSRFLAYSETVPWKSPMRERRASWRDWAGRVAAKARARAAEMRMKLMIPCGPWRDVREGGDGASWSWHFQDAASAGRRAVPAYHHLVIHSTLLWRIVGTSSSFRYTMVRALAKRSWCSRGC